MLVVNHKTLTTHDLPQDIKEQGNPILQDSLQNSYTMDDMTKMYAHLVYNHLNQNKKETCEFLNINFRTLVSRLKNS